MPASPLIAPRASSAAFSRSIAFAAALCQSPASLSVRTRERSSPPLSVTAMLLPPYRSSASLSLSSTVQPSGVRLHFLSNFPLSLSGKAAAKIFSAAAAASLPDTVFSVFAGSPVSITALSSFVFASNR